MLTTLNLNSEKVKLYNQRMKELRAKFSESKDLNAERIFADVTKLSDEFLPYSDFQEYLKYKNILIIQEDYRKNFTGVYISDLNASIIIEHLTDYKDVMNCYSPIHYKSYGVADNASQVLDYYNSICEEYSEYMKDKEFVIILTPIFRTNQSKKDGWRWNKWGQYIGKFKHKCEYLYDEENIDFVLCFKIVEVVKTKANEVKYYD